MKVEISVEAFGESYAIQFHIDDDMAGLKCLPKMCEVAGEELAGQMDAGEA